MANPNPPLENLRPFKPGQSGNPAGKPKGRRNLSTIVRDILEQEVDWKSLPVDKADQFEERYKTKAGWEALVLAAFGQAMVGDGSAREWLRKSGYGDKVDVTSGEKPIPILGGMVVQTNDSASEDSSPAKEDPSDTGGNIGGQDDSDTDAPDTGSSDKE